MEILACFITYLFSLKIYYLSSLTWNIEHELRPRIVIANKVDEVKRHTDTESDVDSSRSSTRDSSVVYHSNGDLNMTRAKKWVHKNMMCEYLETSLTEVIPEELEQINPTDQVFCMLIDIYEYCQKNLRRTKIENKMKSWKQRFASCFSYMNICELFLGIVSISGLVSIATGFYSGTRLDGFTDDNWVYIVILFFGIFGFVSGIVGFYGVKYKSQEYLKTVLFILFPLWCLHSIYMIAFFNMLDQIRDEAILSPTAATFVSVYNIVDFVIKAVTIGLLMIAIKILNDQELQTSSISHALKTKEGYKGTVKSFKTGGSEEGSNSSIDSMGKANRIN